MFKYFSEKIPKGFVPLSWGRLILNMGSQLLGLFLPIFLYTFFGFDLVKAMFFYLVLDVLYLVFVSTGCKRIMNHIGIKNSIRLAVVFGSIFFASFYVLNIKLGGEVLTAHNMKLALVGLAIAIISFTLYRIMYWVPMQTDMTKFTSKRSRGKQVGLLSAGIIATMALMPFIAGWILEFYNYNILFIIAASVYLLAIIPFSKLPKTKEKFSWSYKKTFKEFFSKRRRKLVLAYIGLGAENVIGLVVWPIFIWELLEGNYFEVGFLSSLVVIITVILQLLIGGMADKKQKSLILKYGSFFYALGWLIKIFIATALQIFISSSYHNVTKIFTRTPFDTLNFELAADQGHYVDEFTVIREMAIALGKALMGVLVIILVTGFNMQWTFILAALAALAMNFISYDEEVKRIEKIQKI